MRSMRGELNRHGVRGWPRKKGEGGWPVDLLCSRDARPPKGEGNSQTILLARRGRTIRMCSLNARSEGQSGCSP